MRWEGRNSHRFCRCLGEHDWVEVNFGLNVIFILRLFCTFFFVLIEFYRVRTGFYWVCSCCSGDLFVSALQSHRPGRFWSNVDGLGAQAFKPPKNSHCLKAKQAMWDEASLVTSEHSQSLLIRGPWDCHRKPLISRGDAPATNDRVLSGGNSSIWSSKKHW